MKSSFKRKDGSGKDTSNHYYFGCPDLDAIFNNELNKSTLLLVEEDWPTKHHLSLTRYFAGCGIQMNQKVIIYDCFLKRWENIIPALQPMKAELPKSESTSTSTSTSASTSTSTSTSVKASTTTSEDYKIAWRYSTQDIKLKEANYPKNLPIMDLSKGLDKETKEKVSQQNLLQLINVNDFNSLQEIFANLCETIQNALKDSNDKSIKRIVFPSFTNSFMSFKYDERSFIKFLYSLKTLIRSTHCVLLMTVPTDLSSYLHNNLRHNFDIVMRLETKIASKEFEDFQGFFKIVKIANLNSFQAYAIDTDLYGFKATKKKFDIEKLYINPEPDITFDEVNKSAAPKKEGPLMCTSKPGGTNKNLEF